MILFLDIDGVLHPTPCEREDMLCHSHLIGELLERFDDLAIVFSSDWKRSHTVDELVTMMGLPRFRARFLGTTTDPYDPVWPRRERECKAWLEENAFPNEPWLAVDDWEYGFSFGLKNLYLTKPDKGLTREDLGKITRILEGENP